MTLCSCQFSDKRDGKQDTKEKENDEIIIQTSSINETRAAWQKPELVIGKMGDLSDKVVADIGAGIGYFSFPLAFRAKKVIAIEIDTSKISFINKHKVDLPEEYRDRLETRLGQFHDPMLERVEVELAIIINTIAYIENPVAYLRILKNGVKSGGRVMIMDFKMKNLDIPAPVKENRLHLSMVEDMLIAAGFENISSDDTSLDYQYIVFGTK